MPFVDNTRLCSGRFVIIISAVEIFVARNVVGGTVSAI